MAEEWDVFALQPGGDYAQPEYLATLYTASQKTIRVELNGAGQGSFAINRTSPECTEAILAQGNLVKVRIPEVSPEYIFAFFLETGDFTLISSEEAGGEMLHFGGRGILSYLEYACAWSTSYVTGGQSPIAGVWRAYAAGTGSAPGQILRRMIEEMQDPDRPQQPLPLLTIDFDYTNDSTLVAWDTTDATDEFSYQVGEDGLAIVLRLIPTGITVQMSPDFLLSGYNLANFGRNLAGSFGASTVRFEKGVNIATELRRELVVTEARTHMLVSGEADKYGTAALSDAADRVTREAFMTAFGTGTTTLAAIGGAELTHRLNKSDSIMFPIANRRTVVSLANPVTVGAVAATPGVASEGYYLPGPEGTNGDFWVGDTVRVHTGTGAFDYNEVNGLVEAITITREDDNHELVVIPELRVVATPFVCPATLEPGTAEGFYGPLGGLPVYGTPSPPYNPTPYVHYWNSGTGAPTVPSSDHSTNNWGFPIFNVVDAGAPSGLIDTCWAGASNRVVCVVTGPGVMTIYMRLGPEDDGTGVYDAQLQYLDGVATVTVETQAGLRPGTPITFTIPQSILDENNVEQCAFWVNIDMGVTPSTAGIRSVAFGGIDWVPA